MATKEKIVLYTNDKLASSMAGPAIRYWELSTRLSNYYEVWLVSSKDIEIESGKINLVRMSYKNRSKIFESAKAVILQEVDTSILKLKNKFNFEIIYDAYDPVVFETLEISKDLPLQQAQALRKMSQASVDLNLATSDKLICATTKQLDMWIGALSAHGRIKGDKYYADESLESVAGVVSFGLSEKEPSSTGPGIREKFGLSKDDKIVLWGGGIWDWFDPLTLIKAMVIVKNNNPKIKLVFMGIKRPHEDIEMSMANKAIKLAKQLRLLDKYVFFNYGWVNYEERQNFLLDSHVGVSTHFNQLETRFSFRTRLLDYLWANLPIISTKGDYFENEIIENNLGEVVEYKDEKSLANAIIKLCSTNNNLIKDSIKQYKEKYYWNKQASKLKLIIESPNSLAALSKKELQAYKKDFIKSKKQIIKFESSSTPYYVRIIKRRLVQIRDSLR
jgi:glycosyltransferase involved in cell wall biosynthesis